MKNVIKQILLMIFPGRFLVWSKAKLQHKDFVPPVKQVNFGDLRRISPITTNYGISRGTPVDRYYIDRFIAQHAQDIRGTVLEFQDDRYAKPFGAAKVQKLDIMSYHAANPHANIVGDLTKGDFMPSNTYDCVIFTQVLNLIFDFRAALNTVHRILKPDGVILASFPGIIHLCKNQVTGDHLRFTKDSAQRAFEEAFDQQKISVKTSGNVLAATAFLYGLVQEDLTHDELDHCDGDYPFVLTVRAVK
jgi:SAM-dependent methyltransferase